MSDKKKKVTTVVTTTVTKEIISTNELTQIVCIADRSGSMSSIIDDSIGGYNSFLEEQKKLKDKATLTLALFDDQYELVYDNVDVQKVEKITKDVWMPRGMTALYDAIGKTITTIKANHAKLGKEAPGKVLCVIITDGQENSSKEYKLNDVKKLIKNSEEDNWNFMYLAANQDAFAVGSSFGVSTNNTINYTATAAGVFYMSAKMSAASMSYRSMSSTDQNFKTKSKNLIDDGSNTGTALGNSGIITTNTNPNPMILNSDSLTLDPNTTTTGTYTVPIKNK
jgi:hypothetical protein